LQASSASVNFRPRDRGFIKEGAKLEKTTLQNIAPTYARLIGTGPPKLLM
jgi:hypothetical protein